MMTRRASFPGSDLAGVATAMITHKAAPALLSGYDRYATGPRNRPSEDFADPLRFQCPQVTAFRVQVTGRSGHASVLRRCTIPPGPVMSLPTRAGRNGMKSPMKPAVARAAVALNMKLAKAKLNDPS
jgi:hypothetical protein